MRFRRVSFLIVATWTQIYFCNSYHRLKARSQRDRPLECYGITQGKTATCCHDAGMDGDAIRIGQNHGGPRLAPAIQIFPPARASETAEIPVAATAPAS